MMMILVIRVCGDGSDNVGLCADDSDDSGMW